MRSGTEGSGTERSGTPHLHLLLSVLGRVLAALALPAQLLQLGLTLLQTLPFALVLHLVFLEGSLKGATESRRDQLKRAQIKAALFTPGAKQAS